MTTPGYKYPIPAEYKMILQWKTIVDPPIQTGKSFFRHTVSDSWTDGATFSTPLNFCLRGKVSTGVVGWPDITVSPTSLEKTLPPDTTQDYTLTIGNDGGATLTYAISDREATCGGSAAEVKNKASPAREIEEHKMELNPSRSMSFSMAPLAGTELELKYDDGEADDAYRWHYAGNGFAVRFTPLSYPVELKTARLCIWEDWPDSNHEQFAVEVYDDDGAGGAPGSQLGTSIYDTATDWGWWDVDISGLGITINDSAFYILYKQFTDKPDCEALCVDRTNPDGQAWDYFEGEWYPWEGEDYMIRCVVEPGASENCPWLDENPKSGSVEPGGSDSITVSIDTTGLAEGDYSAEIIISSNDPDEPEVIVPVTLHVGDCVDEPSPELGFASLIAEGKLVIAYNLDPFTTVPTAVNGWTWYDPTLPPAQNNLNKLSKYTAYWVKVTQECWFTYRGNTYHFAAGWNNPVWLGC
jgi:hypothetical protein